MIEHVPELIEAGITSFKIEGRNKTAYYAACVTGAYRAAIDVQKGPENFVLPQFCRDEVNKVSHREYYTGFYFGNQENGQHYGDSQYIREYEVVGMPVESVTTAAKPCSHSRTAFRWGRAGADPAGSGAVCVPRRERH